MIGTTLKLGFDATAVQRGLSHVGGLMGRFGRQIAIGGARQIGAGAVTGITALVDKIASAVPDMMDWTGELVDMSAQTNTSIQDLMVLQRAFELAGASVGDSSKMISMMRKNLQDAADADGPVRDALHQIGLEAKNMNLLTPAQQVETIFKRLAELGPEFKGLEQVTTAIFGGKMGYKMIRFARDFDGSMSQAKNDVGAFGKESLGAIRALEGIGDAVSRWQLSARKGMVNLAEGLFGVDNLEKGAAEINKLFDGMDSMTANFRSIGAEFRGMISDSWKTIQDEGVMGALQVAMQKLGEAIGKGIILAMTRDLAAAILAVPLDPVFDMITGRKNGVTPSTGGSSKYRANITQPPAEFRPDLLFDQIKNIFSPSNPSVKTSLNDPMLNEMKTQTTLLQSINREGGAAMFS